MGSPSGTREAYIALKHARRHIANPANDMLRDITLAAGKSGRSRVTLRPESSVPPQDPVTVLLPKSFSDQNPLSVATNPFQTSQEETVSAWNMDTKMLSFRVLELEALLHRYNIEIPPCDQYLRFLLTRNL